MNVELPVVLQKQVPIMIYTELNDSTMSNNIVEVIAKPAREKQKSASDIFKAIRIGLRNV